MHIIKPDHCVFYSQKQAQKLNLKKKKKICCLVVTWVPINFTSKVPCGQVKDLCSNPAQSN